MKTSKSIAAVSILTAALVAVAAPASFAAVSAGTVMLASSDTPNMYAPQEDDTSLSGTMPPTSGSTGAAPGSDTAAPGMNEAPGGAVTAPDAQQPAVPAVPPPAAPDTQAPDQEPPAATAPPATEQPAADQGQEEHKKRRLKNYAVLKAGLYVPSRTFDLDTLNPNISNGRAHFQTDVGFAGELAVGRYLIPGLAMEFGTGYFQRNADTTMVRVVPVTLSAKLYLPLGPFEPYGLAGIGGYVADQDIKDTNGGTTDITYGFHLGAGFDINIHRSTFIGLEGKYLWSEPSFRGQNFRLDGFNTTVNLGFRF